MRSVDASLINGGRAMWLSTGGRCVQRFVSGSSHLATRAGVCQMLRLGFDVCFVCAYGFNRSAGIDVSIGRAVAVVQPNESRFRLATAAG